MFSHCKDLFSKVFLPSHDHLHHHRVWEFAKSILYAQRENGLTVSAELIDQLIIAVFFHDTGLTITADERHGQESRKLCEAYFRDHAVPTPPELESILQAIEHHDDKSYHTDGGSRTVPGLLQILSGADDLDALGRIGIYRYAEIYQLRGIPNEEIPGRVLGNVRDRYASFRESFRSISELTVRQEERYKVIVDFFRDFGEKKMARGKSGNWKQALLDHIGRSLSDRHNLLIPDRILPAVFTTAIETFFAALDLEVSGFHPPDEFLT